MMQPSVPAMPRQKKKGRKMIELKPCPFCGGKAELEFKPVEHRLDLSEIKGHYSVHCASCGMHNNRSFYEVLSFNPVTDRLDPLKESFMGELTHDGKNKAIEDWNRRVDA